MQLPSSSDLLAAAKKFHAKKRLGQNFLVDAEVLTKIVDTLSLVPGEVALEIGPGLGFLTRYLIASGAAVTAVELDRECVDCLRALRLPGLRIVHGDFLSFDLRELASGSIKVAGNVPYQITSRIFTHLFGEIGRPSPWCSSIARLVMTVQLEVAERFTALPGAKDYSQLTLLTRYYTRARMVAVIGPESFYPRPEVTSAVVLFQPLEEPPVQCRNPRLLRQLIKAGFGQRRKMLRNNLSFTRLSTAQLERVFDGLRLDPQTRAERLSLEQFAMLADALDESMSCQGSSAQND